MSHARIGKVTPKPQRVISIRPDVEVKDDRKAAFANHVAASFESYARKYGERPDSVVVVMGGLKQSAEAYWMVLGDSSGGSTTMLCLAASVLNREIAS